MTDLEFIERLIEDKKLLCKNELFYREEHHKGLQHLQQIKVKLEAWEVVKEKGLDITTMNVAKIVAFYNIGVTTSKKLTDRQFETIKKALEVEDV